MKKLFALFLLLHATAFCSSDCRPMGARICVSGDDRTQIWINGAYIGERDYCDGRSGCGPDKLCLPVPMDHFDGPLICLALRTENLNPTSIFTAWELEVDCEGRLPYVFNSQNALESGSGLYWDPTGGGSCGTGAPPPSDKNGNSWLLFQYATDSSPFRRNGIIATTTWSTAQLQSAQTGKTLPFLTWDASAAGSGPKQDCGVLYWHLVAAPPHFLPTYTPTVYLTPFLTSTPTPVPTHTHTPRPFYTWTPTRTWTRWPTFTPWPTLRPTSTPQPFPTRKPAPLLPIQPFPSARPIPTSTPFPLPVLPAYAPPVYRLPSLPTPIPRVQVVPTQVPLRNPNPPAQTRPRGLPPSERTETLVFSVFPAAFLVTFDAGPGHYQLEVVDAKLKAVKIIYDHGVTNEQNAWVEWDGKDSKRYDVPSGQYYVVYFKDGKPIKSLPIARTYKTP